MRGKSNRRVLLHFLDVRRPSALDSISAHALARQPPGRLFGASAPNLAVAATRKPQAMIPCACRRKKLTSVNRLSADLVGAGEDTCSRSGETPESRSSTTVHWRCAPRPKRGSHSRSGESVLVTQRESAVGRDGTSGARTTSNPLGANGSMSADELQPKHSASRRILTGSSVQCA
jgi:hypothetical protein